MKILESSSRRYDAGIRLLSWGQIDRVQREIVENYITARNKVLDIGCGTGTLAVLCAEKGASVVGFDTSSRMLSIARRKVAERNLTDRILLREMAAVEMDKNYHDGTFDRIVGTLVFSEFYLEEQQYVLREAYRILKPGGLIVIADEVRPNSPWKRVLHLLVRVPLMLITYILTQASTKALKDIEGALNDTGFEIIHQERSLLDSFELYIARKS